MVIRSRVIDIHNAMYNLSAYCAENALEVNRQGEIHKIPSADVWGRGESQLHGRTNRTCQRLSLPWNSVIESVNQFSSEPPQIKLHKGIELTKSRSISIK